MNIKLPWTEDEIVDSFHRAENQSKQIKILAELNGTDKSIILEILMKRGCINNNPVKSRCRFIDCEKALKMYSQGWTDTQISKYFGCKQSTVGDWRRRIGLPPNKKERLTTNVKTQKNN